MKDFESKSGSGSKKKPMSEADAYIKLGHLLKKKRSLKQQAIIDSINAENITAAEKVKQIQQFDAKEEARLAKLDSQEKKRKHQWKKEIAPAPPDTLSPDPVAAPQLEDVEVQKPPRKIFQLGYWSYLFFQFSRISAFGKRTRTLDTNIFPLKHVLRYRAFQYISNVVKPALSNLLSPFWYISQEGWRFLGKLEYNVAVAFYDFIYNYSGALQDSKRMLTRIRQEQKHLFTLIQDPKYKVMLNNMIDKVLLPGSEYYSQKEQIRSEIGLLLHSTSLDITLTNIVLAVNMVHFRNYITLDDLLFTENPGFIRSDRYQCSNEIQRKIDTFVAVKQEELLGLMKDVRFIEFYKKYIAQSYILLDIFAFDSAFKDLAEKKSDFTRASKNFFTFSKRLLDNFFFIFEDFLAYKIEVIDADSSIKTAKLFDNKVQNLVTSLKLLYSQLTDFLETHYQLKKQKVSFEAYITFITTPDNAEERFVEIFEKIYRITNLFLELGKRLYTHLADQEAYSQMPLIEKINQIKSGYALTIDSPYSNIKVRLNNFLFDKTILEVILMAIDFSFNFAHFYKNPDVQQKAENEEEIKNKIVELTATLQRLK